MAARTLAPVQLNSILSLSSPFTRSACLASQATSVAARPSRRYVSPFRTWTSIMDTIAQVFGEVKQPHKIPAILNMTNMVYL
jgi:hypothetical protein